MKNCTHTQPFLKSNASKVKATCEHCLEKAGKVSHGEVGRLAVDGNGLFSEIYSNYISSAQLCSYSYNHLGKCQSKGLCYFSDHCEFILSNI